MSSYRSEQRRLTHRGREFHFVSYEGHPANQRRGESAMPAMWYLMFEGKRTAVTPQVAGQNPVDLDRSLVAWLDAHVFGAPADTTPGRRAG